MSTEVPEWVRVALRRWGRQKRRIWEGTGEWYRDSKGLRRLHIDGYAESFMGRLMDDREGAGQGGVRQHWEEVYWGDGLAVQRALSGLPENPTDALHVRYVWNPECGLVARQKASLLGMKERAYFEAVGRGEYWVWARLDPAHVQARELSEKIVQQALQKVRISNICSGHTDKVPKVSVDFTALNRPKIKLRSA